MEKLDKTIEEINSQVEEFEKEAKKKIDNYDEETGKKAQALVDKTKAVVDSTIEKLNNVINDIKDDERLDDFLDKIKAKSKESIDFTLEKIDSLSTRITLDDIHDEIISEFDKLKENDTFKKTADLLKEVETKINEFFERPDVKEKINKAKVTTVNIAEKGVEGLRKVLITDENKDDETK